MENDCSLGYYSLPLHFVNWTAARVLPDVLHHLGVYRQSGSDHGDKLAAPALSKNYREQGRPDGVLKDYA